MYNYAQAVKLYANWAHTMRERHEQHAHPNIKPGETLEEVWQNIETDEPVDYVKSGQSAADTLRTLNEAHVFEVEQKVALMLEMTNNQPREVRLPFPVIYIDCTFGYENEVYHGILAYEIYSFGERSLHGGKAAIVPMSPEEAIRLQGDEKAVRKVLIQVIGTSDKLMLEDKYYLEGNEGGQPITNVTTVDFERKGPEGEPKTETGEPTRQFETRRQYFSRLVFNFLDFLEDPDVKKVRVTRSPKNVARKQEQFGVLPPMLTTRIEITGELKVYLDSLKDKLKNHEYKYSHKFWVRGHWRQLRSARYTEAKRGLRLWIPPYIKGEGLLVRKNYSLETPVNERDRPSHRMRSGEDRNFDERLGDTNG